MKIKDIYYYAQGNIRYKLFYSIFAELIPNHVREQIIARVNSMDFKCFKDGQCQLCGCQTTHLQMCNKACDKPCYPAMLSKKEWKKALLQGMYHDKETQYLWSIKETRVGTKFKLLAK